MRRMGSGCLVAVLLAALACGASGQAPPPAPTLSTEERLTLENGVLKIRLLQAEIATVSRELTQRVQAIEADHPGYAVDVTTLMLVAKPAASSPPKPPTR